MQIICNNKPRPVIQSYELTDKEQFDYETEGPFFRYRGAVYDIGEFTRIDRNIAPHPQRAGWEKFHGYLSDTFFSGMLIKYDGDSVIVARFFC